MSARVRVPVPVLERVRACACAPAVWLCSWLTVRRRYEEAIAKYSEAIGLMSELDPDDDDEIEAAVGTPDGKLRATILSNRAQVAARLPFS